MNTPPIIHPLSGPGLRKQLARVARALVLGKLVGLPTDTVYGLACRASAQAARQRIFTLKGRAQEKPLPFLLADPEDAHLLVKRLPWTARKLVRLHWPGPLTLVLGPSPGVALRVPDQDETREVLRRVKAPVSATSANRSGQAPATLARQLPERFGSGVDLVLEGDLSCGGRESSLVRITPAGEFAMLREGALLETEIKADLPFTLILVCTGNTCRSPMGAAILADMLQKAAPRQAPGASPAVVLSAGLAARPGAPLSQEAGEVLREYGLALENHGARPLSPSQAARGDLIYALTEAHVAALKASFPGLEGRLHLLDPMGQDIPDPIGGDRACYRRCFLAIRSALEARLEEILGLLKKMEEKD